MMRMGLSPTAVAHRVERFRAVWRSLQSVLDYISTENNEALMTENNEEIIV